jgi:hypothetical protein
MRFVRCELFLPTRGTSMKAILLAGALAVAVGSSPARAATQITVDNIGAVLNESLALPAQDTPGLGIGFSEFFEFTLPTSEIVTVSVSDSAIGAQRITGGELSLNTQTGNVGVSPFEPTGSFIEGSSILNVLGGQEATVAPDALGAGAYFAEVSGISGGSPIHIAIDGTITAVSTPEPSTWAMLLMGAAAMAWASLRRGKSARYAL